MPTFFHAFSCSEDQARFVELLQIKGEDLKDVLALFMRRGMEHYQQEALKFSLDRSVDPGAPVPDRFKRWLEASAIKAVDGRAVQDLYLSKP